MGSGEPLSSKRPRKNRILKQGESFAATRKPRKKSPVRRVVVGSVLASLIAVVIVGGGAMVEWVTKWTEIQQITILGLDRIPRDEILTRLALPPHSSLLSIEPDLLSGQLETHPWIGSVTFDRIFPHSLVVEISERQPAAVLGLSKDGYFLDVEGYLLPNDPTINRKALPIVEGITSKFFTQDEAEGHRRAKQGIHLAALLSQHFSGRPRVNVSNAHTTVVDLPQVRFQFGQEVEKQWQRFVVLYPTVKENIEGSLKEVDLRFFQKVILRKRTL
ncbi:MAG: FtsQ-type POTRA domain-containing protein [Nitrospirales bacterium]